MDPEDEVEREYPLYASTIDKIFSEQQKLTLFEYPLRPPWRPYESERAEGMRYKPGHSLLQMRVPQEGAPDGFIHLAGQGCTHDSTLCVMVKVDDTFTLLPVDDIIQMRVDMSRYNMTEGQAAAEEEDPEYKPPTKKAAEKPTVLNVEMVKRETERQIEMRMRSHAHMREQQELEPWQSLKVHSREQGSNLLVTACRKVVNEHAAGMKMDMTPTEYLNMISPSTWIRDDLAASKGAEDDAGSALPKTTAPTSLSAAELSAITIALTALFEAHSVVSLDDVRTWLRSFHANPAAAKAATVSDAALNGLLVGGGSIVCVKGKFVLAMTGNETTDPFRRLVLDLLEASAEGVKKSEVIGAAKMQDMEVSEHLYNKVLKELCVAQGSVWSMRHGANF